MKRKKRMIYGALALILVPGLGTTMVAGSSGGGLEFDDLTLTFELNNVPDAGVLLHADTSESLHRLMIRNPAGRHVFGLVSKDRLKLGLTEIFWETAEPDVESAFLAYPEGDYAVTGITHNGQLVSGVAHLSHNMLPYPTVTAPKDGDELPLDDLLVEWVPDPEAESYWIEFDVETDEVEFNYTIPMPEGTSKFELPESLLLPGADVFAGVAAVGSNGNATVQIVEVSIKAP